MVRTFIDTTNVGDKMGAGLARHLSGLFQGAEGSEWETTYYKHVDVHKAVKMQEIWRKQEGQGNLVF